MNAMDKTPKGKVPAPSRKAKVKIAFAESGQEVAWTLGQKLRLKPSTLRTWFATWRREGLKIAKVAPKAKAKVKPAPKVEPAPLA